MKKKKHADPELLHDGARLEEIEVSFGEGGAVFVSSSSKSTAEVLEVVDQLVKKYFKNGLKDDKRDVT